MDIKIGSLLLIIILLITSCFNKGKDETLIINGENTTVTLTSDEISNHLITTVYFRKEFFPEYIEGRGKIETSPSNTAIISVPIKGFVKEIYIQIGDYISKGTVLAIIKHPAYIELQQQYLEAKIQCQYYKEDFKRQGELSLENATSLKNMQMARSEYNKAEIRLFSLYKQLEFIGIDADTLNVENISAEVSIKSPISGYITSVDAQPGKLCGAEDQLFRITGNKPSQLLIKVGENEFHKIKKDQKVEFLVPCDSSTLYFAVIITQVPTVESNGEVLFRAGILRSDKNFTEGLGADTKIFIGGDSVYAIPSKSILYSDSLYYLISKKTVTEFEIIPINPLKSYNELVAIKDFTSEFIEREIVNEGNDFIFSKAFHKK